MVSTPRGELVCSEAPIEIMFSIWKGWSGCLQESVITGSPSRLKLEVKSLQIGLDIQKENVVHSYLDWVCHSIGTRMIGPMRKSTVYSRFFVSSSRRFPVCHQRRNSMELSRLEQTERKPYETPAVVYETRLEVRAGSGDPPTLLDPLSDLFDDSQ
jgi:hypothetical protein